MDVVFSKLIVAAICVMAGAAAGQIAGIIYSRRFAKNSAAALATRAGLSLAGVFIGLLISQSII